MRQEVKKHIYPNGLTLLVDEAPQLTSVAIAAWVKTGSRHEDLSSAGICHFMEHMLFKGSKKRSALEISKAVDRVGGDFNAFTSREHTCFHFYLPAKEIGLGGELLKEILFRPLFENKEIEKERQVILQEIAMVKESPEEEAFDRFLEVCFGNHPLGRQILGNKKSIDGLTRKQLFSFFHQHYRPENMVLSVAGAVKFETAKRALSELGMKPWPQRQSLSKVTPQWGMDPPKETLPGFHWLVSDSEQAHVMMGIQSPTQTARERLASAIIQQHLGGGMSSVLFDEIREKKGWAYTVYASLLPFLDVSLFTLYAGVKNEKVGDTLAVFKKEMGKIARDGIPSADLKRIKESLLFSYDLSMESSEARMMHVSQSELFFKRTLSFKEYQALVKSVTVKDTQRLMSNWLKIALPTIFVLAEKPKPKQMKELQAKSLALTHQAIKILKE